MRGYQLFTLEVRSESVENALDWQPDINPRDYGRTRRYGDGWVEEGRSLALKVPSVVLPLSYNYLVNPKHPAFDSECSYLSRCVRIRSTDCEAHRGSESKTRFELKALCPGTSVRETHAVRLSLQG